MKKLFVLSLALLLLLSGCGASAAASGGAAEPTTAAAAEPAIQAAETAQILDLTGMSSTILLAQLTAMQNGPEEYLGKTVRMQGTFLVGTGEDRNYYYCMTADTAACCQARLEFLWEGHAYPEDYPAPGSQIIIQGVFDTYWEGQYQYMQLIDATLETV